MNRQHISQALKSLRTISTVAVLVAFSMAALAAAHAQTLNVIYNFTGQADGGQPGGSLIADSSGNYYGTSTVGGDMSCPTGQGCGTVFKLSPAGGGNWTETVLYAFTGAADGSQPIGGLAIDASGTLYGTTFNGGSFVGKRCSRDGCGTVFKLSHSGGAWHETVLYAFAGGSDGLTPFGNLTLDASGNIYGVSTYGGSDQGTCGTTGCGNVFELSPNGDGTYVGKILHIFTGAKDGNQPQGYLALDSSGNIYGETQFGGGSLQICEKPYGCGALYELSFIGGVWKEHVLHSFNGGPNGALPIGGLTFDGSGNLYGATQFGGDRTLCTHGCGVVFEFSPTTGVEIPLYAFPTGFVQNGAVPSHLTFDSHGNFFGTTELGGENLCGADSYCGSVFKFSPNGTGGWNETTVYSFVPGNGFTSPIQPYTGVIPDSAGNLYGTTQYGGDSGNPCTACGTAFKVTP